MLVEMPDTLEVPVVFSCEDSELLGIVHRPEQPMAVGVLALVAGGPQYRGGCGRQLVSMARSLASGGIPVMRFDHRGLGDSGGDFLGFQHIEQDIRAAIDTFSATEPGIRKIVLWGGCDAASAALINAWRFPEVCGVILGNPFVSSAETKAAVSRQHYIKRLTEWSFWRKVFTLKYDFASYVREFLSRLSSSSAMSLGNSQRDLPESGACSYIDRMLFGLQKFDGPILFLMSGRSLVSKEFDALVARSASWSSAYNRPSNSRVDLPDADQTFSSAESRSKVNQAVQNWILALVENRVKE